jgi:flavin-dependent dehydrogenase
VFPLGDGTVNVGVGLLSTARDVKGINPTHLLDAFVADIAERWGIDPGRQLDKAATNRIPMGASVAPLAGPTFLVIGDAGASANPFSGEGIGMAYETGRLAADVLHDALDTGDAGALQRYPTLLRERHDEYQRTARVVARLLGHPAVARRATQAVLRSRRLFSALLRIESQSLRPDDHGAAELTYRALATVAHLTPGA